MKITKDTKVSDILEQHGVIRRNGDIWREACASLLLLPHVA